MIKPPHHSEKLSFIFRELARKVILDENVTLDQLIVQLHLKGHAIIVLLFSLPFLLPIPLPGLSVLFGMVMAFSGLAMITNRPLWIPKFLSERRLPKKILLKLFITAAKFFHKFEYLIRPRFVFLASSRFSQILMGLIIVLSGIFLFLPLPPGTNFPPALVCILISLGLIEKDGLFIAWGVTLFVVEVLVVINLYTWIENSILNFFEKFISFFY
jgi:hypothetical protein